jgi:small conductance mechanosensitive channel
MARCARYKKKRSDKLTLKVVIILGGALAAVFVVNFMIDKAVPRLMRLAGRLGDRASEWRVRRLETYVGILAAMLRVAAVGVLVYVVWQLLLPRYAPWALVGASAVMAILASSVIGPLLRDVAFGSMMIAEGWYNVGDHIVVEPFMNVSGVVERLTPRSTKLRSLTGEVIWLHNQHIQGARVTSRGVRTMALDVFVDDLEAGKRAIERARRALPTGPTMVARQLEIDDTEQLSDELWRVTAVGQIVPGREWLFEDFALKAINKYGSATIVHGPIARYTDAVAENRFRRTVRAQA